MDAREFLKQKGILDYDEFIAYQKADSDDHIPIEELMEEYAELKVKNCNTPAVSKSLPTDEQLGGIVHKIAYTQQAEEQGDDFINKVWILKNFIEQHFNIEF